MLRTFIKAAWAFSLVSIDSVECEECRGVRADTVAPSAGQQSLLQEKIALLQEEYLDYYLGK